jgi:hypothetical protein
MEEIEAKNNQAIFDCLEVLDLIPQFHGLIGKVIFWFVAFQRDCNLWCKLIICIDTNFVVEIVELLFVGTNCVPVFEFLVNDVLYSLLLALIFLIQLPFYLICVQLQIIICAFFYHQYLLFHHIQIMTTLTLNKK